MAGENKKTLSNQPMRWPLDDWAWLGEIAKSLGLTRSEFVRRSAIAAATATANGMAPYYVGGPQATPHNTRPTDSGLGLRQQAEGRIGGEGSRTASAPEGTKRQLSEKVGRQGGAPDERSDVQKANGRRTARS